MRLPLLILLGCLLGFPAFSQYKIRSATVAELRRKTLAILVDGGDSVEKAGVRSMFTQYWNLNEHIVLCTASELPALMRTGEYIFLRHQARISTDEQTQVTSRTDYLSLFSNEFLEDDIALCYTNRSVMHQNLLSLKFYIKALQQAIVRGESTDSSNVGRNIEGLNELRLHTLFIPSDLIDAADLKLALQHGNEARSTASQFTFRSEVVSPARLNSLSLVDSIPVFMVNVVGMPDHHPYLYICEVNTGRILYKNILDDCFIRQLSGGELNTAISQICSKRAAINRTAAYAGR